MKQNGFTLVELMVAIFLVLIIMLGVNTVFRTVTATVASNQAISDNTRDARAAQLVLSQDFASYAPDAPCLLILSCTQAAFRNRQDELSDQRSAVPVPTDALTIDLNGNNVEGEPTITGEQISPATPNFRNHRTDILSFFGRGLFKRQTGGTVASGGLSPFIADQTTSEAWLWFGHLRLPDNNLNFGTLTDPGAGTIGVNPHNLYATQWILAREQILLTDKSADNASGQILDNSGAPQIFLNRTWTYTDSTIGTNLSPLAYNSADNDPTGTFQIQDSRWDLAAVTLTGFKERLQSVILDQDPAQQNNYDWYSRLFLSTGRRFQCNPFAIRPLTPARFSQQSPVFMRGCTQFIVEYAGDFLAQNVDPTSAQYGYITETSFDTTQNPDAQLATDGVIDFVVGPNGRQVRWYGFPRDVDGDGTITGGLAPVAQLVASRDVIPLRDYWQLVARESTSAGPWEKDIATKLLKQTNYTTSLSVSDQYICAWGPNDARRPKMIRIIFTLDDPDGRLANRDGQTFEAVFELP